MIALIAFILAVVAAAVVGLVLAPGESYVLLSYGTTRVEFTLFIFIVIYIVALALGAFVVALLRRIGAAPARFGRARASRATRHAERLYAHGLTALAEGRVALAERMLERAARGPLELPALLAAARAAASAGARDRRDGYLGRARRLQPDAAPAVALTRAELDFAAGNYLAARELLEPFARGRKPGPALLRRLAETEIALGDHRAVLALLEPMERTGAFPPAELENLAAPALAAALAQGREEPASLWREIPRELRRRPALLRIAARANARAGASGRAAQWLEQALDAGFDAGSVCDYVALAGLPARTRLRRLESWLDRYGEEPVLLREAGRVALELQLWGQARGYLERARSRGPDPVADGLAGALAEARGEQEMALASYRSGLAAALPGSVAPAAAAEPKR